MILRRITALVPSPASLTARDDDRAGCGPLTVPPASRDLPSTPPSHLPGVCYHHGHVEHDGERFGVLVLNDSDASLMRCRFLNRDGR